MKMEENNDSFDGQECAAGSSTPVEDTGSETFSFLVDELVNSSSDSDGFLNLIRENSDSEDEAIIQILTHIRQSRNSIKNYFEEVVPTYTDEEFLKHFRISKELFATLTTRYEQWDPYKTLRDDKRLPAAKNLAVFLWFAGHGACSFRDLSDRFNLTISSISRVIDRVTMFISSLSPEVIKWPSNERKQESANYFAQLGFPKAIACIDGTHIRINPPSERKDDYIDRKGHITLVMQGICDERRKFINAFVGFPGSSHDSWVLQNSPVYNNLTTLCGDYYLLGDSAYPCSDCIITPFKDNGHLTRHQKYFNKQLSKGRILIEHSFGILKQRFRQLYYCKLKGIKKLCCFIGACCVLHNLASENDFNFSLDSEDEERNENGENIMPTRNNNVRNLICEELRNRRREV